MSEIKTDNNQVAIIHSSLDILKTGPEILIANQTRKDKALAVGRSILTTIQENGMTPETDERAKNYLVNINKAGVEMKEDRAGVTQIMDQLKKMYTEVENELDPKKAGTVPAQIQAARDEYVKQQAIEAERKRKEAERAAEIAKEKIEVRSKMEVALSEYFNNYLLNQKQRFTAKFNSLVLDSFADDAATIRQYKPLYKEEHFNAFSPIIPASFDQIIVHDISVEVKEGKYQEFADRYVKEMLELKEEIVAKLPSKHTELQEQRDLQIKASEEKAAAEKAEQERQAAIAKANAADKERLEAEAAKAREEEAKRADELKKQQDAAAAEQKRREEEETKRIADEAAAAQRQAEQEAEIKKQGEQTMAMFEKEATIAETAEAPEARLGYEITILHPVAFTLIFAMWFEKVGKDLPVDKIGNTKLDQMKAWAEKEAQKSGTKIDSKFIKYEETFKAVNRKAK